MNYEIKKKEEKCYLVFIHVGLVPITFFGLETFFFREGIEKRIENFTKCIKC